MIEKHEVKVTTTGSAGTATGSGNVAVPLSELVAVHIDYDSSAPNTTDVTITSPASPASQTLLVRSNSATDGWFYPVVNGVDNTAAAEADSWEKYVIHGNILVAVAQGDAITNIITVTFYIRR